MPTELEELVGFLHHGNTQIRQIATENLVPYSKSEPAIFKAQQLLPITDLKLLVKDYPPIARNALTILVNISTDPEILKALAEDDTLLEIILQRITNPQEPNANLLAMLLANLAKSPSLSRLITLSLPPVPSLPPPSPLAITQLLTLFNTGITGTYNKHATYDYLAYLFADLAKYPSFQTYLTSPSPSPPPLTLLLPYTTHPLPVPRLGAALLLRNLTLTHPLPLHLLYPPIFVLPPLLLPLCSADQSNITTEEMDLLPESCQYLTPDEAREETDVEIIRTLLEVLYLLVARGGGEAREAVRGEGGYVVVREGHLRWEDEGVRGWCERVVDVLMVGEGKGEGASVVGGAEVGGGGKNIRGSGLPGVRKREEVGEVGEGRVVGEVEEEEGDDDDNAIVPIF